MALSVEELLSHFDESRFISALKNKSKAGVIREIASRFGDDDEIRHPDILREALESREKLGSTGIGKEIAIPHGRTLAVPRLKALIARSRRGVPWESADGKAVKLFFVVVAPPQEKGNVYLPLLGALVGAMSEKKHRDAILAAKSFPEVLSALEEALRG